MHHDENCTCEERRNDYLPPMGPLPPRKPMPDPHCHGQYTRNYGLPLWKASDVTSWLTQMNAAMMRIDEVMHDLALRTGVNGVADDLAKSVGLLINDVEVLKCNMSDINNKAASNELLMQNISTQMSAMHTNMSSLELSMTNIDTRIMTVESANKNQDNSLTLVKADLKMLADTVKSFREAFGEYQLATNKSIAENSAAIESMQGDVKMLQHVICNTVTLYKDNVMNAGTGEEIENSAYTLDDPFNIKILSNNLIFIRIPKITITDCEKAGINGDSGNAWITAVFEPETPVNFYAGSDNDRQYGICMCQSGNEIYAAECGLQSKDGKLYFAIKFRKSNTNVNTTTSCSLNQMFCLK